MKLFSFDMHPAVVSDVAQILTGQGHTITLWNTSTTGFGNEFTWLLSPPSSVSIGWNNIRQFDRRMAEDFVKTHYPALQQYDAFLVSYPPAFAHLYESLNKPIIVVAAIRYEFPYTQRPDQWRALNELLKRPNIVRLANSEYDTSYARHFTGVPWTHVTSLCDYTSVSYRPLRDDVLLWEATRTPTSWNPDAWLPADVPVVRASKVLPKPHRWKDVASFKAIVHVPYNASYMAMFEQYAMGIPLLVPTHDFLMEMYSTASKRRSRWNGVLSELSFLQVHNQPPKSWIAGGPEQDPNDYENVKTMSEWMKLADHYTLPEILYFDSWDELKGMIAGLRGDEVSGRMKAAHLLRREKVWGQWSAIMGEVEVPL